MQFVGQTHLLRVPLDTATPSVATLKSLFETAYLKRFRVELADIRVNLVNVNTSVIGERPPLDLSTLIDPEGRKSTLKQAQTDTRPVMFDGAWHHTPIYWRDHMPADAALTGPAIIEQMDTTTLLEPGDSAATDAEGNILITLGGGK
jgi:N-methylhydantoinase A